jgi:hypothetical protein
MKNVFRISVFFLAAVLMFSSCKKDEMSIENAELTLSGTDDTPFKLNYYQPSLDISGKIKPEDAVNNQITIKVTSKADPTGFEVTYDLTDGDYVDGKTKYLYKNFYGLIFVANYTDADKKYIKVGETDAEITVTVGDNLVSKTYEVISDEILSISYALGNFGYFQLYGYSFDGTENKQIEAWTGYDDTHITFDLEYNDPTLYQALPKFNNYEYQIKYNIDNWSNFADSSLGVYDPEIKADTFFLKYDGKTYYSVFKQDTRAPLLEL